MYFRNGNYDACNILWIPSGMQDASQMNNLILAWLTVSGSVCGFVVQLQVGNLKVWSTIPPSESEFCLYPMLMAWLKTSFPNNIHLFDSQLLKPILVKKGRKLQRWSWHIFGLWWCCETSITFFLEGGEARTNVLVIRELLLFGTPL